jgi:hypothetical protein
LSPEYDRAKATRRGLKLRLGSAICSLQLPRGSCLQQSFARHRGKKNVKRGRCGSCDKGGESRRIAPICTTPFGPADVFVRNICGGPVDKTYTKFGGQWIWLTDINEGRSAEIVCVVRRMASKRSNMGLQRRSICLRGVLESCLGIYDYRGFGFCWSLRSIISRSAAISLTEQLKSQLAASGPATGGPGPAAGHTPVRAVYRS